MSDPSSSPASPNPIEDAAAAWVLRHDRGLTPAEQDDYLQWLAADPRHGAAFRRHRVNWDRLDLLGQWRPEHGPRPNRDLLAPPPAKLARVLPFPGRWIVAALTVAAAVAFGLFLHSDRPAAAAGESPPAVIATIERRTLDDGTTVDLNRGAELAVEFTATERRVRLVRGEAFFTVAKNPECPFIVHADGVDVRAVGTAFNVRLGKREVEVLVTEGKVQVAPMIAAGDLGPASPNGPESGAAEAATYLTAGERAVVSLHEADPAPVVATVADAEMKRALAWQPRLIDFEAAPLRDIVAEFNARNAPYHLVVADAGLAELQVSATLRSDNIEGFLRLLESSFSVQIERTEHTVILRGR